MVRDHEVAGSNPVAPTHLYTAEASLASGMTFYIERTMDGYPFKEIESKWIQRWADEKVYSIDLNDASNKKYVLIMICYPSEKRLHVGHWLAYGPADTYARYKKMQGYRILEPMGFDAFGLPAENFAIKHGVHPATTTRNSVKAIRKLLQKMAAMYDWDKAIDTSQPEYYKWTQWLFLQLFKSGDAYQKHSAVNWCPKCLTVLANEQVLADGTCDHCDTIVETRDMNQWFFRITDFADELLEGLDRIDWPESTKSRQRHWIGRSEGTEIEFLIEGSDDKIVTFTTRPDTIFGVTYVVLAPEHSLVEKIVTDKYHTKVDEYVRESRLKSDIERMTEDRKKTGIFSGAYAMNPVDDSRIPIWIADYVLATYGTGAVMAVPAHDQRDYEFSSTYQLPIKWVINPSNTNVPPAKDKAYTNYGAMTNSDMFDGLDSKVGGRAVTKWLSDRNIGRASVNYRLRDWSISRQRYWGTPIPVIHCPDCGPVAVPEADLPVILPEEIDNFKPGGTSPLGAMESFINTSCPECGIDAKRDVDTMDTFVDSSWYFLKYPSVDFPDKPFDAERTKNWLPVDVYVGGPEHATGHLIYARYITKFLHSKGLIDFDEPFQKMVHQGIVAHNGQRMSKSKGNMVNPDEFMDLYGADCLRVYIMFMGEFTSGGDWSDKGIVGIRRFQSKVWRLVDNWTNQLVDVKASNTVPDTELNRVMNYSIREITRDLDSFQFNTPISRLMEFYAAINNFASKDHDKAFLKYAINCFITLFLPFAPHQAEELWEHMGNEGFVFEQDWLEYDEKAIEQATVTIAVQIKGKLAGQVQVAKGMTEQFVMDKALEIPKVNRLIDGKVIRKKIYIQDRILNIVV